MIFIFNTQMMINIYKNDNIIQISNDFINLIILQIFSIELIYKNTIDIIIILCINSKVEKILFNT